MTISLDLERFCQYVLAVETEHALREFAEQRTPPAIPPLAFHAPPEPGLELSVVMPVWNPNEQQFTRALRSLAEQDFGDIRHEIVVSDDASTNGVVERCLARAKLPHLRCHRHAKNIGGMPNFNWSVASARGQWIHMLHQDDWIEPGFYAALLRGEAQSSNTDLRFCRTRLRDDGANHTRLMFDEAPAAGILDGFMERQTVSQRIQFAGTIFSRRAVETVGGFDETIGAAADWEYWARIGSRFRVYYHPGELATYVLHQASWSNRGAAGFADARAFEKYRIVLQRMVGYVPAERRRATAQGFLRNMLQRMIEIAMRNRRAGTPRASVPVGQALFAGCRTAGLLPDIERVLFGA